MDAATVYVVRYITAAVALVLLGFVGCEMHQNQTGTKAVERLVAEGHNPVAAHCAVWGFSDDSAKQFICMQHNLPTEDEVVNAKE